MLLQSHHGELHPLPCLPTAWPDGSIRGMKARGGFTVDMEWKQIRLTNAVIHSDAGTTCELRTAALVRVTHDGRPLPVETQKDGIVIFPTEAGETFVITPEEL